MSQSRGWSQRALPTQLPQTSVAETGAALDMAHLRRYTSGDLALEIEILNLFLAQTSITIAALGSAAVEGDWAMAAHSLKGSARAVGAWRLATAAESAEKVAFDSAAARRESVRLIAIEADAVRAFIAHAYPAE